MTGRRRTRTTTPLSPRPRKAKLLYASALVACASVAVGCGVIPGATGGSGDDPVRVMTWAPEKTNATNKPGMPALAKAYARWVNAHGGINGRKLEVLTCNDQNDSVAAAHCAERAADEKVVAVVGSYSQHSRSFLAPLESAGIPYIGGFGVTDDEFTSPISYPINGGQPALLAGLGEQLGKNCGPVSLIRPDTIAGDELPVLLDAGLKALGHPQAADQRAAEDATEYSQPTKQALQHATSGSTGRGCVVPALGDRTNTFMDSFRRDSADYPKVHTGTVIGSIDQSLIDATGGKSGPYEGSYVTGWYPTADDARWNAMRGVIKEQAFGDNRIDPADAGVQTTWIAYTVLKKVLESLGAGEISSLTIRRELDNGLKVTTGGLTPTLSWRFEDLIGAGDFPRLVNADVTFQVIRDGQLTTQRDGFINMAKTLANAG
ncbi:ABC transporter substrate-binding protein [Streptomyces rhizosphaerihabitans]|uniref:ABC transporter substrate-binding protein n=1 Tax=Streptomyces rhizosphaerihabitans TaxID=1266770 RepID=UPI0021C22D01|nr:ABC transporter substrate-binding protein [Streptomyces rhizosphaerihabitans]MCT9003362.1 ABC transporter substrate-binding protein [Streptomyces rhizosphaerihabitans]